MIKCKFSSSWRQIFEKIRRVKFLRIVISYDCVVIEGYRTRTWLLLFAFSPPLLFRFSYLFFPPLTGHLVGFILVGNGLGKTFRILGLNERKGRWVVEQDFHGNFRGNVTWFFAFFSGVLDWIVLILVWFERSFPSAQVRGQSYPWILKLMTSQVVERTRIRTGGYWRLRGECVKINYILEQNLLKFQWLLMIFVLLNFYLFWSSWAFSVKCA